MADGAPNGWSVLSFDGTDYHLDFRAAGRSADYQMEIDAPDVVKQSSLTQQTISANVFNGSKRSIVELRVGNGQWRRMTKHEIVDPKYKRVHAREAGVLKEKEHWRPLPNPKPSSHLWQSSLPADVSPGSHLLEVRATDQDGRVVTGQRIIRVQ